MVVDEPAGIPLAIQGGSAHGGKTPFAEKPEMHRRRYLIVVSRDQPDLCRHLRQMFAGIDGVDVVLDRRHGRRWQWTQSRGYEERGEDRRRPCNLDAGIAHRSFVIVNPEDDTITPPAA